MLKASNFATPNTVTTVALTPGFTIQRVLGLSCVLSHYFVVARITSNSSKIIIGETGTSKTVFSIIKQIIDLAYALIQDNAEFFTLATKDSKVLWGFHNKNS